MRRKFLFLNPRGKGGGGARPPPFHQLTPVVSTPARLRYSWGWPFPAALLPQSGTELACPEEIALPSLPGVGACLQCLVTSVQRHGGPLSRL